MTVSIAKPVVAHELVELEDPTGGWRSSEQRRRVPGWTRRLLGPALLLLTWWSLTGFGVVDGQELASPPAVWDATREFWSSGELQHHLAASLGRVSVGLSLGVGVGLALAVLAGFFRLGEDVIDSSMNVLRAVPVIALLPMIIVWVGIGESAKITLIVIGTAFPIYMNTFAAIRGVDARLVEAGRSFGLGRLGLITRVVLPGALPGFLVGLRWAIGVAWLLLVFAEQINATSGIGYLITQAQSWNRIDVIIMGLVVYGLLGLAGDGVVRLLERTLLSWRRGFDGT